MPAGDKIKCDTIIFLSSNSKMNGKNSMNVDTKMESRWSATTEYKLNSFVKWVDFLPLVYLICSYVLKYIKTVKTCVLCQKLYTIKRTHKNIKKDLTAFYSLILMMEDQILSKCLF